MIFSENPQIGNIRFAVVMLSSKLFSGSCSGRLFDGDARARGTAGEQRLEPGRAQRNTPCRWREARSSEVDEHRASKPGDARPCIVIDLDDKIIEMIRAPQAIAGCVGRAADWAIVGTVAGVFTPGVVRRNSANRQQCSRRRAAICAPPKPHETKAPAWRGAVALTLVRLDAGPAERYRNSEGAGGEPAPCPIARTGAD